MLAIIGEGEKFTVVAEDGTVLATCDSFIEAIETRDSLEADMLAHMVEMSERKAGWDPRP